MNKVIIRNAKSDEGTILAEIEKRCFPEAEAASEKSIIERLHMFPENFFVAEADGEIVGFINGGATDEPHLPDEMYHDIKLHKPNGKYQTVFGLSVLEEYRKNGIGGMLIRHMIEESQKRGRRGVILTCKDYRIAYYEKFGFINYGLSDSSHGNASWYDMRVYFE